MTTENTRKTTPAIDDRGGVEELRRIRKLPIELWKQDGDLDLRAAYDDKVAALAQFERGMAWDEERLHA